MTLEEKAAQMICIWQQKAETLVECGRPIRPVESQSRIQERPWAWAGGPTQRRREGPGCAPNAEVANAIQRFFLEESRLGIPVIFHEECLHGHAAIGGTSFPQPIGLGATFDPDLIESLYAMTALEARARGAHQALTPVGDVARDPRWGRVEETFGEDPFLVSRMGIAAVRGFQGDATFRDKTRLIADAQTLRRTRTA